MKIKYFNDEGEELFPKYLTTKDVWYLDRDGKNQWYIISKTSHG